MHDKKEVEYYTWPEKIVGELRRKNVREHIVHGMWTPSGYFHIGNARSELITPMLVFSALKNENIPARFNFFVDDFDDLDKIPDGLDVNKDEFESWLGKPLYEVPSPVRGFKSWAEYFASDIKNTLESFGSRPEWHSSYESYKKGLYDPAIRIVLNDWQKVNQVWERVAKTKKEKDQLPVMVVCENCGRSSTTYAYEWDHEKVKYKCKQDRPYAQSCGYDGEVAPEKGRVKLPWRLHWPATWFTFGTTFESAGKDHFASGGSVESGHAFMREIFKTEPPYQEGCEFVTIDGKKISGSLGNVISLSDWMIFAEPEILRFMYASYQPPTVIEFNLHSNKFFLLTDRYDEAERCYYGSSSITEKRTEQLKRQYVLAQIKELQKERPMQFSYSMAVMLVQAVPNKSIASISKLLRSMGALEKELTEEDEKRISLRLQLAEDWLNKYAPDDIKIKINEEAPEQFVVQLSEEERKAVSGVRKELDKDQTETELQSQIYEIARKNDVEPKTLFRILYQLIISKEQGPKLAPFIIALGRDRVKKILEGMR